MTSWDPSPQHHEGYGLRYPVIDIDPHFRRVVSYFRSSDYAAWAGLTAASPVFFVWLERMFPPSRRTGRPPPTLYNLRHPMLISTALGAWCSFLIVYSRSSFRFMGLMENQREYERDHAELSDRIKRGLLPYGEPAKGPESTLRAAHYNSMNSQFQLGAIPWFNLSNHPWHGRDLEDYSKPCDWKAAFDAANAREKFAL